MTADEKREYNRQKQQERRLSLATASETNKRVSSRLQKKMNVASLSSSGILDRERLEMFTQSRQDVLPQSNNNFVHQSVRIMEDVDYFSNSLQKPTIVHKSST